MLPEVTSAPHHELGSFRVRGRIFATFPPNGEHIHAFVPEQHREQALAMYPAFAEKLRWGGKVVGVRIALSAASPSAVKELLLRAWESKAPKTLVATRDAAAR